MGRPLRVPPEWGAQIDAWAYSVERDLLAVQTLLGHASPSTTRRYVAISDETLRRTMLGAG